MWIHEHPNWPDLTWRVEALASRLADVCHRQGLLIGRMEGLGFEPRREAGLGMDIAGLAPASRDVEGIVEIVLDAAEQCSRPLTRERLFDWHAALFPTGRSGMRKITAGGGRSTSYRLPGEDA